MDAINLLGLEINVSEWNKKNHLPIYIGNTFCIKKANINGMDCIMLIPHDELPTITSLKKQISTIKEIENIPVFLNLKQLSKYRRDSLLTNKIPFILNHQLVYLPFLGTVLTDKTDNYVITDKFTLSAQLLFLWILYNDTDKYFISDAINTLPFTNMTITRAYRQLVNLGLFKENKEGRKIYLTTSFTKIELFKQAKTYFITPITMIGYIEKNKNIPQLIESGETALSNYTMINPPLIQTYAIEKKYKNLISLENDLINPKKQIKIEIWEYAPNLLSKDKNKVDYLSLAISLMNSNNERVQEAIEEMIKNI